MKGILEKFCQEAKKNPLRELYNFLDCSEEPFKEQRITVGEAWERSMALAAELKAKGAKKGDRAIILSMQDAGTVYAVWGCMIIGVVFTLIPPPLDQGKLNRFVSVLKSCEPKFLISNEGLEKTSENKVTGSLLRQAFFQVLALKRIYTDKIKPYHGESLLCAHEEDDLLYLQYTSGSTSAPKGVMVTYKNLMTCIDLCQEIFDFQYTEQRLASWVPFYHNIGLVVAIFMPAMANAAISYFIHTIQFLQKPAIWLQALSKYKATVTAAPNSAYEICTKLFSPEEAKKYDLSSMTHFINGSEVVDSYTVDKFCERFSVSHDAFAPGYGLSECVCVAALSSRDYRSVSIQSEEYQKNRFVPAEDGEKTIVSLGRPAADMKILIVRPDGNPCGEGEIGEIYLKGSNVCAGYWKNPEASKAFEAVVNGFEGKFYRTGDMGAMYEGQLYITGRLKEMIIISGKNIFPSDLILLLREKGIPLPAGSMAVFSVRRDGGERPILCAECGSGEDFHRLAAQINKIILKDFEFSFADIVFVEKDSLPRTDNRKVKTLAAKEAYEQGKLKILFSTVKHGTAKPAKHTEAPRKKIYLPQKAKPEEIQPFIRSIFESLLPGMEFGDEDSFMEMGGDSLRMMELVCDLEEDLDISIDLREVVADPSVKGISLYISALLEGNVERIKTDLRKECVLDEKIVLENRYTCMPEDCKNIFVTGSTGFLGAYLIKALIRQREKKGVRIYCHGRGASPELVMDRIEKNMQRFHCWDERYREFIVPVPGDLNQAYLGMDENTYETLADCVDMVIHNGAILNFVLPYSKMKLTNVTGTARAIAFACHGKAKYFHYISSYSVYDNPSHFQKHVLEDDPLESPDGYFLGYSETKWVAEKLVGIARERGLRASVYRPGDITGTLNDGIWKLEDLISRSIVGCIQLGYFPEINVNLHLTPVDYVAEAIVCIAFKKESQNRAFNIINQKLMPMKDFYLLVKQLGYQAEHISFGEWCEKLEACTAEENVLRILSCLFTDKRLAGEGLVERFGVRQAEIDSKGAEALLKGSGIVCPPVNEALIKSYLSHFAACGYIPKPEEGGRLKKIFDFFR